MFPQKRDQNLANKIFNPGIGLTPVPFEHAILPRSQEVQKLNSRSFRVKSLIIWSQKWIQKDTPPGAQDWG